MEFRYQIPEHLEGFIGDMSEPHLNALMTFLFEYAIQHRMLDYPRSEIENSVDEIRRLCLDMQSKQSIESSLMLQIMSNMNAQIASLHVMLSGGQLPPAMYAMAPVAYPPMYQAAPTAQQPYPPQYAQPPGQEQPASVIQELSEDEINTEWQDTDENKSEEQAAFEDELFK